MTQARFLINDELMTSVEPGQAVLQVDGNDVSLSFDVSVDHFEFCRATCNLELVDPYAREVLGESTHDFSDIKGITKNYSVDLQMSGAGERAYYLLTTCRNRRSLTCQTDGDERYNSALVTVRRNYTRSEWNTLTAIQDELVAAGDRLESARRDEVLLNRTILAIGAELPIDRQPSATLSNASRLLGRATGSYRKQDFTGALRLLGRFKVPDRSAELARLQARLRTYNDNVRVLHRMANSSINEAYRFYNKTNATMASRFRSVHANATSLPQSSFGAMSGRPLVPLNRTLAALLSNYTRDRREWEADYNATLHNYSRLLSRTQEFNLTGGLCGDALLLANRTALHNDRLVNDTGGMEHLLQFINSSLFQVESNGTHLLAGNRSVLNDAGLNLTGYLMRISYPQVPTEYCGQVPPLFQDPLTNRSVVKVNGTVSVPGPPAPGLPVEWCCIYGECEPCKVDPQRYPVIFLHGHSVSKEEPPESSVDSFAQVQRRLSEDGVVVNAGSIDYGTVGGSHWSRMDVPVGVRGTYYYLTYYDAGEIVKDIRKEEGIDVYSVRLKELVDIVLNQTGAERVVLVVHSMGGLVARNYLRIFGGADVDRVMLIATPNQGIPERVAEFCAYLGNTKACHDMYEGSAFMRKLNQFTPETPVHVVAGSGCDTGGLDGDGVVTVESARLPYANLTVVNGTCRGLPGVSLHGDLLDPKKYPEAYQAINGFIEGR